MPNLDKTGHLGKGPLTGRGLGDCPIDNADGQTAVKPLGRGMGRGTNRGRGVFCRRGNANN